jgi:serine-type D-Ala-D-Ala endopeptidase (penicillin-binding protein 7)
VPFSSTFRAWILPVLPLALLLCASRPADAKGGHAGPAVAAKARGGKAPRAPRGRAAARQSHPKPGKKTVFLERRVPAIKGGLPNVQALGALVVDENGRELFSRSPDHERPIASISKLAATLAVMDRGLELDGLTTITRSDVEVARRGARSRLLEGMTLSNRDLLHAALMGSDNRAIPALGRAVKLTPSQLADAMTAKARQLGLKKTRFHDPTGLSIENVSTPRETIAMLQAVMRNPVLGPITQRVEYDAHPVGKAPITYFNTYRPAIRNNVHVLGGKTGYNDDARYCLVLAAKIDGQTCYMSFLANEGKLTRFGDVARVADWMVTRKGKPALAPPPPPVPAPVLASATTPAPVLATEPAPVTGPGPAPVSASAPLPSAPVIPTYDVAGAPAPSPSPSTTAAPISSTAPAAPLALPIRTW